MARYTGPREKIERRLGEKLFLKGERSLSPKSALARRPYAPGEHGKRKFYKLSEFGQQLKSKQKVRNMYRLLEKAFKKSVKNALLTKLQPYDAIIRSLEMRIDNTVFRGGFAQSKDQARQIVNHGHILVNKKKVSIPSHVIKIGDVISVREGSKKMPYFANLAPEWLKNHQAPSWIELNKEAMTFVVRGFPTIDDSGVKVDDLQAIIEYYSR